LALANHQHPDHSCARDLSVTTRVIPTAGSIENVHRLAASRGQCAEMFAFIQDGAADARLELLGRLPQLESLLLLGRQGRSFRNFSDLRRNIHRHRPGRLRHSLSHASAFRGRRPAVIVLTVELVAVWETALGAKWIVGLW